MKRILVILIVLFAIGIAGHYEHIYKRSNCVVKYADEGQAVILDAAGFEWYIEKPAERLYRNDIVTLKMHDNYTDTAKDDIIIDIIKK